MAVNLVEFEVTITPKEFIEVSDFMARLDLGINALCVTAVWSWRTSAPLNARYFKKMEKAIRMAVAETGGRVHSVKCRNTMEIEE